MSNISTSVAQTYLFKNRHQLGLTFMYETDYSVSFENKEYFFVETFGDMQKLGKIHVYLKREDGQPGERVENVDRVLNLIRLNV